MPIQGAREQITGAALKWEGVTARPQPHHFLPQSGWVSFYIREEADIEQALELLHQSYELAWNKRSKRPQKSTTFSGGNK